MKTIKMQQYFILYYIIWLYKEIEVPLIVGYSSNDNILL